MKLLRSKQCIRDGEWLVACCCNI